MEGGVQEPVGVLSCSRDNEERLCEAKPSLNSSRPQRETGSAQKVKSLVEVCVHVKVPCCTSIKPPRPLGLFGTIRRIKRCELSHKCERERRSGAFPAAAGQRSHMAGVKLSECDDVRWMRSRNYGRVSTHTEGFAFWHTGFDLWLWHTVPTHIGIVSRHGYLWPRSYAPRRHS